MGEFFRGWKRKAGCISILIALTVSWWWAGFGLTAETVLEQMSKLT